MKSKLLMGTLIAAGALAGLSTPAMAERAVVATGPGGYVQYAPPAPRYEVVPAPREGFTWAPGHYEWRGNQYTWVGGHWLNDRPGYEWREARWIQRSDGSWYLAEGGWVRDRYANNDRYDREYDRDYRRGSNGDMDRDGIRNADDDDRDGDGVANWNDDFPNNPNRS